MTTALAMSPQYMLAAMKDTNMMGNISKRIGSELREVILLIRLIRL